MTAVVQVLGVGSHVLTDDGAGPAVVRRLGELGVPPGVVLTDGGTGGLSLLDMIADGCARLVVVDAMSTGASPGTVQEFTLADLPRASLLHLGAMHGGGFVDALALRKALLGHRPEDVRVLGIEARDTVTFSEDLTPEVAAAVEQVAGRLREWLLGGGVGGIG